MVDVNDDKDIEFREYLSVLSTLSSRGTLEQKTKFMFNVLDIKKARSLERLG